MYQGKKAERLAEPRSVRDRGASRGVSVILLRNEAPLPLDPETFRAAVARAGRSRHARPTLRAAPGSSCVRDSLGARVPSAP